MSSIDANSLGRARPDATTIQSWLAVIAVALSTFTVVTTEMLPVGLLSPMAAELNISLGTAGLLITLPAILAAFFSPTVVIAAGAIDRRALLCSLLALLVIANTVSALAPTIQWLIAARVAVGLCMGGIWGVAGGLSARLVAPASIGMATALIFGGVAAASVLGVPLGVVIGDLLNWRAAFWAMAAASGVVLLINLLVLPALPVASPVRLPLFVAQLSSQLVRLGLAMTLLMVGGHFMAFTYVRPLLQTVSEIDGEWMGVLLFGYGTAGIFGNFVAGILVARHLARTLIAIASGLAFSTLLFQWLGAAALTGIAMLLVWGLFYGGVSVSLQTWMMRAAPTAVETVTSLFVAVFNIGIALGSLLGGRLLDLGSMLFVAGCLPVVALALAVATRQRASSIR